MKPETRRFSKAPKKPKSLFVRVISSPLTTLLLGILAFGGILYYKKHLNREIQRHQAHTQPRPRPRP
ncbi:MAG: hypothetical protein AAGJ35_14100, partial [Myxococcota bacterium]